MLSLLRMLLSLDLVAVGCERVIPVSRTILPLGGSELTQLGIFLILLVFVVETGEWWRERRHAARLKTGHHSPSTEH